MKFSTTKEKLLGAVLIAERIVGKKESLPVLSCVLLDANTSVAIRATNLEAGVDVVVPCTVEEKGVAAVAANILSQTLRSISGDKVSIHTEDGNVVIESKGTRTLIKALPHDEFPAFSKEDSGVGIKITKNALLRGIQSVLYAASPSMIRPELGSVFISIKGTEVVCVATDSFRLAERTITSEMGHQKEGVEMLVPLKHASELVHVLERAGNEVECVVSESQLVVTAGGVKFVSRVVDGNFPNYKDVIPKTFTTEATILKNDLAEMLRKARVFSGNDQHIGLHIYPQKKIFTATAQSANVGEMSDSVDAAMSGEDLDMNFHIGYLGDCLSSIESDSVTLYFAGIGRPLVIRGVSDPAFTYLVMPLNR